MLLNYVHGNPRPRKTYKKNPVSFKEVEKIAKDFSKVSKVKSKPKRSEKKAVKASTEQALKKQQKRQKEISDDFSKLQEGEKVMAKKKAKRKSAKMFHAKVTVHKKAKKASKRKVAKKTAKKSVAKKAVAKKSVAKVAKKRKATKRKASKVKAKTVAKKARKVSRRKKRASGSASGVSSVEFTSKSMPRGLKDMKKGQKRKVLVTVAPKKRKSKKKSGAKKKNPIVRSNPSTHTRFEGSLTRKNPFYDTERKAIEKYSNYHESSMIQKLSVLRGVNDFTERFLGVDVLEISSIVAVSALDGLTLEAFKKLKNIETMGIGSMVSSATSWIPAKYETEVVNGAMGVIAHLVNEVALKKFTGKKSLALENLAKAMILKSMITGIAKMSPYGTLEAPASAPVSGLYYAPRSEMGAITNQDFQGVDFEGVDFEGVDFEGIVSESNAMSGLVMEGDYSDEDEMEVPDYTLAE